jgi:hypothetical protein
VTFEFFIIAVDAEAVMITTEGTLFKMLAFHLQAGLLCDNAADRRRSFAVVIVCQSAMSCLAQ